MENESQRFHVGPRNIHYTKRNAPPVHINNVQLSQEEDMSIGLHLDRKLTRHKYIFPKRKQLGITLTKTYWLLGRKSKLLISNKPFIYKAILKPIWTYGIQLWGYGFHFQHRNSRTFPIESLAHYSGRTLALRNTVIRWDLHIPTVKEEIRRKRSQYSTRLSAHPNDLIVNLTELPDNRRLRRHLPNDLLTRFLV
jgi:hypothetical protein